MHQFIPSFNTVLKTVIPTALTLFIVIFKTVVMDIAVKLVEWIIPEMLTKEKEWVIGKIIKGWIIFRLRRFQGMTIEEIAKAGKEDGK